MSQTWISLTKTTPGQMIELARHRVICKFLGHDWSWTTGTLTCRQCRRRALLDAELEKP